MATKLPTKNQTHAVVHPDLPETGSYTPIVIGPGTGVGRPKPKAAAVDTPYTMTLQIYTGDTSYNGTVNVDLQCFGIYEDASGNTSLIEAPAQIPVQNPNNGNNRKQTIQINGQNKSTYSIYVTPNGNPTAIMVVGRAQGGGSFGNLGVYWFDIES